MRARMLLAGAVAALLLVPAGTAGAAVRATAIASFDAPVYVAGPPGDAHRLMVVEQSGVVRVVRDGAKLATPFLDISGDVRAGGEQGLLSIAFAPDYASTGKFYAYYNVPSPRRGDGGSDIVIDEFTAASPDRASASTRRRLVTIPHPDNTNHNGGQLQFGPDGMLYAGTGDGGSGNDPPGNAQNRKVKLGKLLRLDPRRTGASVYAYGLRNPYRFSFDRATGDLTIGDVGQGRAEEIDFAPRGTGAGANYGWRCMEGFEATPGVDPCTPPNYSPPVLEQDHGSDGFCAIIGGYVVRDPDLEDLAGRYVYGDNCQPQVRSAVLAKPRATGDAPVPGLSIPSVSGFGEDTCGHVYVVSLDGPLYRLDGDGPPTPCADGKVGDAAPPAVLLTRSRTQPVLRRHGLIVAVRCDESCGLMASARLRVGGLKRPLAVKRISRFARAGRRTTLRLALPGSVTSRVRDALARGRSVIATVTVVARDAAGNERTARAAVRVVP